MRSIVADAPDADVGSAIYAPSELVDRSATSADATEVQPASGVGEAIYRPSALVDRAAAPV